jgi:putative NADPH-quinone reductase
MPKEAQTMTVRITGIAGSLRRESFNRKLLHAAAHEMPHGAELTVWDGLGAVPPFSEDLEAAPAPAGVTDLRQVIAEADGLLFATPEYNGSVPGQLKNAIDLGVSPTLRRRASRQASSCHQRQPSSLRRRMGAGRPAQDPQDRRSHPLSRPVEDWMLAGVAAGGRDAADRRFPKKRDYI